jgi:hypothetical protein
VKVTETTNYVYISSYATRGVITIVNKNTLAVHEFIPWYHINAYQTHRLGAADGDDCWFVLAVGQFEGYLLKINPLGELLINIFLGFDANTLSRVGSYLLIGTSATGYHYGKVAKYDLTGSFVAVQTGDINFHYTVQGEIVGVGTGYWAYVTTGKSILKLDANLVQVGVIVMPEDVFGIVGKIGDNIYLNGGGGFYRVNAVTDMITFFAIPVSSGVTTHFRAAGIDGSLLIISASYGLYTEGLWFFDTATETFTREAVMVDDSINHFAVGYGWKRNSVYYALDVSGNYVIPYL